MLHPTCPPHCVRPAALIVCPPSVTSRKLGHPIPTTAPLIPRTFCSSCAFTIVPSTAVAAQRIPLAPRRQHIRARSMYNYVLRLGHSDDSGAALWSIKGTLPFLSCVGSRRERRTCTTECSNLAKLNFPAPAFWHGHSSDGSLPVYVSLTALRP